jgi:undecaprenyl-diphosphatase
LVDFLYNLDVSILYFINHTLSNPFFDKLFPFLTEVKNWYIAYVILFLIIILKGGRIGRIAAIGMILLVISTDQFSSFFLKNMIGRIRPCNVFNDLNILVTCTNSYSFPSSHAVNNFGAAIFFTMIFPKYKWYFFTVAVLMAFSRPYVGVHYPSDVLGGAIIGLIFGYVYAIIVLKIDNFVGQRKIKLTDKYERIR